MAPGRTRKLGLPRNWPAHLKSAVIHAASLASSALTRAWGRAATSRNSGKRLQSALDRTETEIALLREQLALKDARWGRLPSRRRPHYSPTERLRILQVQAARGWSRDQAARSFLLDEQTLQSWHRRIDERGEKALLQTTEPVNRYPDFVRYLVQQLKVLLPTMGKVRIAQVLARAGLRLGATTVGRIVKVTQPPPDALAATLEATPTRVVRAKYPGHVWHVDLTTVPIGRGFWVPWLPFSLPQSWPFCWWVAVVVDHFSRSLVGFAVLPGRPTSRDVQAFLDRAIRAAGAKPRHLITDKGRQFIPPSFGRWCHRRSIRRRFGAVRKHGSIAIVERLIRSMKNECTRRVAVPFRLDAIRRELALYANWFNEHRPHQGLGGRTPREVYDDTAPANARRRFEPRRRWPHAKPRDRCDDLALLVSRFEGRKHLPIVQLRRAA